MPPEDDDGKTITTRPSKDEIETVRRWIDAGAPDILPKAEKWAFVGNTDVLVLIRDDLSKASDRDRKFLRYFTITHLHNAGVSDDELASYRAGLSKLVNSLSWGRDVTVPKPIDSNKTIFRIDLRDFEWDEKIWDAILAANPYGLTFTTDAAKACYGYTGTSQPFVRADWFVFAASRPPLYHTVLQIPTTSKELQKKLGVETERNIRTERVWRAGFNGSGVSGNNRLIERHKSSYGAYWESYDFAGNVDRQNLFSYPLGPGNDTRFFRHDGGELIFNLPNGLQGYMLIDGQGKRIDKGPVAIVSDPKQRDRAVVNGVSCMTCHDRGMIRKADQVRDHVLKNRDSFPKEEAESILALYTPKDDFEKVLEEDEKRFKAAVERAGAHLSKTEPVSMLARLFENEIGQAQVAAELGVTEEAFVGGLNKSPTLARVFGVLRTPGGTIKRDTFIANYAAAVAIVQPSTRMQTSGDSSAKSNNIAMSDFKPGEVRKFEISPGILMEFCWVPAGKATLGSPVTEKERRRDETEHDYTTKGFWLGKYEVTQAEWKAVMGANPSHFSANGYGAESVKGLDTARFPVESVSWDDCQKFLLKVNAKGGVAKAFGKSGKFALPHEDEWEYACRGGKGNKQAFYFGDILNGDKANSDGKMPYGTTMRGAELKRPTAVGSYETKAPHPWGLNDMHGNVWEWCDNKYEQRYDERVLRGGSWWNFGGGDCRAADRVRRVPGYRFEAFGCRVVFRLD